MNEDQLFIDRMLSEVARARKKFPHQNIWVTLSALTEEVGELNQAVLQFNCQPEKAITPEAIYAEAVQVAVMALRVARDCAYHA